MRRSILGLTVLATASFIVGLSAQQTPNFSGVWSGPPPGPPARSGGPRASLGNGWGESFTIIQHSDTLTVERVLYRPRDYQPTLKFRYALDGSESHNTILMGRGMQVQRSTAAWDGDMLVLTMSYDVLDADRGETVTCEVTQTLSLQRPRQAVGEVSLVIETTRCGILGGLPSTTRTVYTKN
jgi:hypothetical protein